MTAPDEKTDKEKKTHEKTDTFGLDTNHGLASLEVAQVEVLEKSTPEKVASASKSSDAKTRPDIEDIRPAAANKTVLEGNTRASVSYRFDAPEQSWPHRIKRILGKSEELASGPWKVLNNFFSELFGNKEQIDEGNEIKRFIEFFGPTVLISFMFFSWVVYDRNSRVYTSRRQAQAEKMTVEALEELSKNNKKQAEAILIQAIKASDNPDQTKKLQSILERLQ